MNNPNEFAQFLEEYFSGWKSCSLDSIKSHMTMDFQAREVREVKGEVLIQDYGYEESIEGWSQAFRSFEGMEVEWKIVEGYQIPLRENEMLVTFWVGLSLDGKQLETAHFFTDTIKRIAGKWKLCRSYIEAGIPVSAIPSETSLK
ncbi:flavoprotein [Pseudalkalibacillus berkeleyi]|uniref:Flavoprotein n=1 Tax=Pseudalkalibacillus berkeleyi TaxID=1069813 RepID=A0ABS9GYK3_9BACL|nr:flavoprotein [Pseudalkalibacillus berkeleyi]MCF6136683.1 flavoprotein [Pseudalkalibacillus berkeleyi]